ncbi:hypothetical protein SLS60_009340 [Paraconiothyrium brasiliense]|uniref:Uncharacterized protein n=1 Tax=Paraconiothyrium brasiliense TaxID=300254 RepID=A0ABR3QU38_9PLEO
MESKKKRRKTTKKRNRNTSQGSGVDAAQEKQDGSEGLQNLRHRTPLDTKGPPDAATLLADVDLQGRHVECELSGAQATQSQAISIGEQGVNASPNFAQRVLSTNYVAE